MTTHKAIREALNTAQSKLLSAQICHPNAVQFLIEEAIDAINAALAAQPARVGGVPDIDYEALINAAFAADKRWAQGTYGCIAFARGAEWYRDQVLTAATQAPAPAVDAGVVRDDFLQGVCVALQVVTSMDCGVTWREIVRAAGEDEILQYAAVTEPEEWDLAGFSRYAAQELKRGKPDAAIEAAMSKENSDD